MEFVAALGRDMRLYCRDVDASGLCGKRGMRGAKRPRPVFSGQPLGAPLSGIASAPFLAYHLFRMAKGPQI
jgi:hypothetical protein